MAIKLKGLVVWAVVCSDPRNDDQPRIVSVQIFADREEARQCLRQSAKNDAKYFKDKIVWYCRDTNNEMCDIYCGEEPRISYLLEAIKIR